MTQLHGMQDLRGVLVEGKKRRQRQRDPNWPDSPGVSRVRSVRKITPIQRPGPSQHIDISVGVKIGENLTTIISSDSQEDQLKLKLQVFYLTPVGNQFVDRWHEFRRCYPVI